VAAEALRILPTSNLKLFSLPLATVPDRGVLKLLPLINIGPCS